MKQLLFSARLVALKSYGVALGKSSTTIAESILDFQGNLLTANSSQETAKKAIEDYRKVWHELTKWLREIGDEALAIEVLFKVNPPKIEPIQVDPFVQSEHNFNTLADKKERSKKISEMKEYSGIMLSYTVKVATEGKTYLDNVSKTFRGDNP